MHQALYITTRYKPQYLGHGLDGVDLLIDTYIGTLTAMYIHLIHRKDNVKIFSFIFSETNAIHQY